jgi:glycosyltransferase involved in cell wall biosynthesis
MTDRPARTPRIAIVHDWLTGMRGGEKVLVQLARLMPQAEIFTLIHTPGSCPAITEGRRVHTSVLNALPGVGRYYRHLLALMPAAVEAMDLGRFDVVISSSHCVAKGFGGRRPDQVHVCYCYTPMRYVWAVGEDYEQRMGLSGLALRAFRPYLKAWDRRTAGRVDLFVAISRYVAQRIRRAYGRESVVLYPPPDVDFFRPADVPREDFYLMVTAFAPYKKVDQAVEAFRRLGRPLKIIGSGQQFRAIQRTAPGNVELLGWREDDTVRDHYRRCRAVIFPPVEDFGLVPLEAAACGAPVIAHGAGGALETVLDAGDPSVDRPTGLLYRPQTPDALAAAVERFEALAPGRFSPSAMRTWAEQFSPEKFAEGFRGILGPILRRRGLREPW